MQFTIASVSLLLAGLASATPYSTSSASPSSSASITPTSQPYTYTPYSASFPPTSVLISRFSAIPSASWSSIEAAGTSQAASVLLNTKNFECVYKNNGCNWFKNDYSSGESDCGKSVYEAGQEFDDGSFILAVSATGDEDCKSAAGSQCCAVLDKDSCSTGQKYLECVSF